MAEDISQNGEKDESLKFLLETSYPLLKEYRDKCPGSFKHSKEVASMIEGISIDLGLNVTFMQVAATYHDVGKMLNPLAFSENQPTDINLHDGLDPKMSYEIISRHVADSAFIMLQDGNFPIELIKTATQHHGSSLMAYFFKEAKAKEAEVSKQIEEIEKSREELKEDEEFEEIEPYEVIEDDFRYKGSPPTSIEAVILMICDRLESRSRTEKNKETFDGSVIISEIIEGLDNESQLDIVTLGQIKEIKAAFEKELQGTYQKRVDYEEAGKKSTNEGDV